jgi:hypothetical protein
MTNINISTRAAELKAQLLKEREARSATPPVGMLGQAARQPPATATSAEQELNINELISQYADPKPAADAEMKNANNTGLPSLTQRPSSLPETFAKSQEPSLGSPTKLIKPHNGKIVGNGLNTKNRESRHASSGSTSEGEIFEDQPVKKAMSQTEPKEAKAIAKPINQKAPTSRKPGEEQSSKISSGPCDSSLRRPLPNHQKPQAPRHIDDRRDDADPRQDRRPDTPTYTNERRSYPPDSDTPSHQRRDTRDQNESHRRSEVKSGKSEDTRPILEELLLHDEDLREWLEITGYHNVPYRNKTLNRRRAIAALDAQRNAILAEMAAEEPGSFPAIEAISTTASTMLPPPIRNKAGDRAEPSTNPINAAPGPQHEHVVSNKRPRSDAQDIPEENSTKFARTNDRGSRIKQEDDDYGGRARSSSYHPSRRRSFDDRRDDRDSSRPRFEEGRGGRGRGSSREREMSPDRKAYESRPLPRSRGHEDGDDFPMRDRDNWEDRDGGRSDRRPFLVRGGYRGRAFDPNYRNRGDRAGGRGRGDHQSHLEPRVDPGAFGFKPGHVKPYKDTRGFDRGGKGGQ